MALLGANGAGKSTTLKAISGLLKTEDGEVTRGEIVFDGERINQEQTPADLGLEDGDQIDAMVEQLGGGSEV